MAALSWGSNLLIQDMTTNHSLILLPNYITRPHSLPRNRPRLSSPSTGCFCSSIAGAGASPCGAGSASCGISIGGIVSGPGYVDPPSTPDPDIAACCGVTCCGGPLTGLTFGRPPVSALAAANACEDSDDPAVAMAAIAVTKSLVLMSICANTSARDLEAAMFCGVLTLGLVSICWMGKQPPGKGGGGQVVS